MALNRLDARGRYLLMKEFDNYVKSPRKLQMTSEEFRAEASKEIGIELTIWNVKGCAETFGIQMGSVFKQRGGTGRSVYSELATLTQRIEAIEKKIEGL